jgi:hypothetical protein
MIFEGLTFTVCWLLHNNGDNPTLDHLLEMLAVDKAFFASAIDVLGKLEEGRFHKMPWTRPLKGKAAKGLFEARVLGGPNRQLARFPFCYTKSQEVVLLYGFTKDDGDAPPKFVEKAKLYKDLIERGELRYEEADLSLFQQYQ